MDVAAHIEAIVADALAEVQRNAVPVINQLLREAHARPQQGNHE